MWALQVGSAVVGSSLHAKCQSGRGLMWLILFTVIYKVSSFRYQEAVSCGLWGVCWSLVLLCVWKWRRWILFLAYVWPASWLSVTLQYISPRCLYTYENIPPVYFHGCLQVGHWPITAYAYIFSRVIWSITAVQDKSLFIILYCVKRGNLDKFISDFDLGDVTSSAWSTLYLTPKTAIILSPFVFHSALI